MLSTKLKWILGISVVFLLILATSFLNRSKFKMVENSIETIYQDRLVAHDLVFKMSLIIQRKLLDYSLHDSLLHEMHLRPDHQEMAELIDEFHATRLTQEEANILRNFEKNYNDLEALEEARDFDNPEHERLLKDLNENIMDLSEIQMVEGRRELFESRRAMDSVNLLTKMEIYVLIFLAVVLVVIVVYKPAKDRT